MKRFTKAFAAFGVAAAAIIGSTPAQAQQLNDSVDVNLTVARPLQLFVDEDLRFGMVVSSPGVVTIDAPTGTRGGSVPLLSSRPVSRGIVRVVGEPDAALWVVLTDPGQLNNQSSGDSLDFLLTTDQPLLPVARTDNPGGGVDGTFIVHLGGQVEVMPNSSGIYTGTIAVSARYN